MTILADPLILTLIAFLAGFAISAASKRIGILIIVVSGVFFYSVSTPVLSQRLLASLEHKWSAGPPRQVTGAQAIVILGADIRHRSPEFEGDTVGPLSLERVRYGARLARETGLPILTTGGLIGDSEKSVAKVMAETLRHDFQVPVRWIEEGARNTYENALLSAKMLRAEGIDTVFLVTHSWHMARALEAFREVGLAAIARPTGSIIANAEPAIEFAGFLPNSSALGNSAFALHEWIGRYWYRVRYY